MCLYICVRAGICGQEVVVAGLRSVAGKNGSYAVAQTTAGHSSSFWFPDTLQPETASHHHSFHPPIPGAFVPSIILKVMIIFFILPS